MNIWSADRREAVRALLEPLPLGSVAGRLLNLDDFASRRPDFAKSVLDGSPSPGQCYARQLHDKLDRLIRAGGRDPALVGMARGLSEVFARTRFRLWFTFCLIGSARRATRARRRQGALRSVWGTTPIINIIPAAQADRMLGFESETLVFTSYRITSDFDVNFGPLREWFEQAEPGLLPHFYWLVFIWAVLHYDVFHYFNDRGVLPAGGYGSDNFGINLDEMRILRQSGKAFFTFAYGADFRMRSRTLASGRFNFCMHCPEIGKFCVCNDQRGTKMLGTIARHANAMFAGALSMDSIPGAVNLQYLVVDPAKFKPVAAAPLRGRALRIAHAPNHPHFKGTHYLVEAVQRLQAEGHAVELVMLSGVSNAQVLELIASVDVVADQFIGGSYGYFAVEAMALGKPVLCYIRDPALVIAPDAFPVINAHPETLYGELLRLLRQPWILAELGGKSRRFVEDHLSVAALAGRLASMYLRYAAFDLRLYRKLVPPAQHGVAHFLARKPLNIARRLARGPRARRFVERTADVLRGAYNLVQTLSAELTLATQFARFRILLPIRRFAEIVLFWRVLMPKAFTAANSRQVVMIVISDVRRDPRVEREARALAAGGFTVKVVFPDASAPGFAEAPIDWGAGISFRPVPEAAGAFAGSFPWLWGGALRRIAHEERPFAFHGHDLQTALFALSAARRSGAHFVADFHEWSSENVSWSNAKQAWVAHGRLKRAVSRAVERLVMRQADEVITVCEGIAHGLSEGIRRRARPVVVLRNIPSLRTPPTRSYPPLAEQIGVRGGRFLLLWQGGVGPARMIEPIILALRSAPGVVFVIRGPGIDRFGADYRSLAVAQGVEDRLILLAPVPSQDVVAAAKGADAGIWTLPNACKNFYYALPNKLFEYLAAGLPLLAADFPEARKLVTENDVGLCFDPYSPESIAAALNRLAGEAQLAARFRANAPRALARMDADGEWDKLVGLYRGLDSA